MKKLILIIGLLIGLYSQGQVKQIYPQYGGKWKRIQVDSAFKIPMVQVGIKDANAGYDTAQIYYNPTDSSMYVYTGFQWRQVGSGSTYTFPYSVVAPANAIQLENDTTASPANYFYGRNSAGRRGWYSQNSIGTASNGITKTSADYRLGGALTQNTTISNAGGYEVKINVDEDDEDVGLVGINYNSLIGWFNGSAWIKQGSFAGSYSGVNVGAGSINAISSTPGGASAINISPTEILNSPHLGNYKIDTLNNTTDTTGKKIMLRNTVTGLVENIDPALIAGGSGNSNSNVGAKYRLAIPNTNNIKTLGFPESVKADSATSNEINIKLDGDAATPGKNKVYGTDTSGDKGFQQGVLVDTTGAAGFTTPILKYDVADSTFKVIEAPTGGGTDLSFYIMKGVVGTDPNLSEDSNYYQSDTLIGKYVEVFRNDEVLFLGDSTNGYTIDSTNGKITLGAVLLEGERIKFKVYNSFWPDTTSFATASTPPPPAPDWENLTFTTRTADFDDLGDSTYTSTGSTWTQSGLADQYLPAGEDGMIRFKYEASPSGQFQFIGFKTSNTNGDYTTTTYGAMINPATLYPVEGGALGTPPYNATVGDYIVVRRTGTTVKIQTTTDNITYTDRHTFSASSSTDLYIVYNIYQSQTGYYPKCFNCQ